MCKNGLWCGTKIGEFFQKTKILANFHPFWYHNFWQEAGRETCPEAKLFNFLCSIEWYQARCSTTSRSRDLNFRSTFPPRGLRGLKLGWVAYLAPGNFYTKFHDEIRKKFFSGPIDCSILSESDYLSNNIYFCHFGLLLVQNLGFS